VSVGNVAISAAVEGIVDRAVVEKLATESHISVYSYYGLKGKEFLGSRIGAFNDAARFSPWLVIVDLDRCECAATLRSKWLRSPSRFMSFRVAVRAIEAWLMADAERLANFLHVRRSLVPAHPDGIENPKESLVNLARHSSRSEIRKDMVPRPSSANSIGPAYASRLIEYILDPAKGWRPSIAAKSSDSLRRCRRSLQALVRALPKA
jgi:hypothetical protein